MSRSRPLCTPKIGAAGVVVSILLLAFAIAGMLSLRSTQQRQKLSSNALPYVGVWKLSRADGSTDLVEFRRNGTLESKDDYEYRWEIEGKTIRIETWEHTPISITNPRSLLEWFKTPREVVVLHIHHQDRGDRVSLTGNGVRFTRKHETSE